LHPNLAEVYRRKVADRETGLDDALIRGEAASSAKTPSIRVPHATMRFSLATTFGHVLMLDEPIEDLARELECFISVAHNGVVAGAPAADVLPEFSTPFARLILVPVIPISRSATSIGQLANEYICATSQRAGFKSSIA
jgi:hypothetical protein